MTRATAARLLRWAECHGYVDLADHDGCTHYLMGFMNGRARRLGR